MMQDEDARLHAAAAVLENAISAAIGSRRLDTYALRQVRDILYQHRTKARQAGMDFPKLVALPFFRQNFVKLVRADLDRNSINTTIVNFTREMPNVTAMEIASAMRYGLPHIVPDVPSRVH